ncbi:hypothetical protein [Embleya sp. NPDC005575]
MLAEIEEVHSAEVELVSQQLHRPTMAKPRPVDLAWAHGGVMQEKHPS